jgi:hypothetical protein
MRWRRAAPGEDRRRSGRRLATSTLALVAGAGCGGGAAGASVNAGTGAISPSMSCGTTSSLDGGAGGSCTVVLSSGLRYRCSLRFAQHLAPGTKPASTFEDAKACTRLSRLAVPVALRPVAARIAKARACLSAHAMRVLGGLDFPRHGGSYAPSGELDVGPEAPNQAPDAGAHAVGLPGDALIAFYRDAGHAEQAAPHVRGNVERIRAKHLASEFERAGSDSIVWLAPPPRAVREVVRACVR